MSSEKLTAEQKQFQEECELEFVDRYTDADEDYKKIRDSGIPSPPIMFPWGISRFNEGPSSSRGEHFRHRNRFQHNSDFSNRNKYNRRYRPF